MNIDWMDVRETMTALKKDVQRDYMLRRYEKIVQGKLPWEERGMELVSKISLAIMNSWRSFTKRCLDITVSVIGLIAMAPVMSLVALAIKLDSRGSIIYSQTRVGLRGKHFRMYKFRTMREDAELKTGPVWAQAKDDRITRIGNFLRKTHLDELPQFFNVLKGEMSLVGPRPERPHFVSELREVIPHYDRRHFAKPGVTGLAQVKRRYDETIADVRNKVRYDVLYIRKMCPLLDLKLIALTVGECILRTGR